ncbi:hypothetical protein DMB66_23045 [Actinoplanes sp. ATCC 53533]|nr:hypothetical protein DMB66_23045 [Actinoplanes sp. ATCC 53533]
MLLLWPPDTPDPAAVCGTVTLTSGGQDYSIVDCQRSTQLWLLGAAFALAVVAFGRWRGLAALLVSLIITAALSGFVTASVHLSGIADETANHLTITPGEVNMRGLLPAGIVMGTIVLITAVPIATALAAVSAVHHHRPVDEQHDHDPRPVIESAQPATRPQAEDPWAAFVERHPGWRNE